MLLPGSRRFAMFAAFAFSLQAAAWARQPQPPSSGIDLLPDLNFSSSPDPLTKRILAGQLADDNGVVSAVRIDDAAPGGGKRARVSIHGTGTAAPPTLPPSPIPRDIKAADARILRDAPRPGPAVRRTADGLGKACERLHDMARETAALSKEGSDKAWGEGKPARNRPKRQNLASSE